MDTVLVSATDGIVELTLNRPKQLNALNWEMITSLNTTIDMIGKDSSARCVVLKGAGNHFMAGGDIAYFHTLLDLDEHARVATFSKLISAVHQFVNKAAELPIPVIASVQGAAAGFGISLVAGCDLAIATETSIFTSAYSHLGTSPDGGSTYYLPRIVGLKKAMEIVLLSERLDAQTALDIQLINKIVKESELDSATTKIARTIASSARLSVCNAKHLIRSSLQNDLSSQLNMELENFLGCVATADFAEGVRAFVDKRKPNFQE